MKFIKLIPKLHVNFNILKITLSGKHLDLNENKTVTQCECFGVHDAAECSRKSDFFL